MDGERGVLVIGSANLDYIIQVTEPPHPGQTVLAKNLIKHAGGKGANQAVAAARLGADVRFVGCVGEDAFADEALAGLRDGGVELDVRAVDAPTGVALILVDADGDNAIAVAPGANDFVDGFELGDADAVLCQLEIPNAAVTAAWEQATGLFCLNAAPARPVAVDPDLTVVNRYEFDALTRQDGLVALTLGPEGAVLLEDGEEAARAEPPRVDAVDGTAAGDAFVACLLVSHLEGRDWEEALRRACAAGAIAASRRGAQPSLPTAGDIDRILGA